MPTSSVLSEFLTGDGVDAAGRTHADILGFDDNSLERHHDFIQWLFPLDEPSRAVPNSPVLDAQTITVLRGSHVASTRQSQAAARMLQFYRDTEGWRRPSDHNHLRITRIIKSLRLISGDVAADAFKQAIEALADDTWVEARARKFWSQA